MGMSVRDTMSDERSEMETVMPSSLKKMPLMPLTRTSGRKTQIVVAVEAVTAMLTSRAPLMAAWIRPSPITLWR